MIIGLFSDRAVRRAIAQLGAKLSPAEGRCHDSLDARSVTV